MPPQRSYGNACLKGQPADSHQRSRTIFPASVHFLVVLLGCVLYMLNPIMIGSVAAQAENQDATFTLGEMGFAELSLRSPYDTTYVGFSMPATWQPNADANLQLQLQVLISGSASPTTAAQIGPLAGILRIKLNDKTVATALIEHSGQQSLSITLPLAELLTPPADRRHVLTIQLETDQRCDTNQFARIIISPDSNLTLPHVLVKPTIDLAKLPFPIIQNALQHKKTPDKVLIVVPDKPTDVELRAALTVAASLGRMTNAQLALKLLPMSGLTDTDRQTNHLVFVGLAASWAGLEKLDLPAPWSAGSFAAPMMAADDGILQMAASAWDAAHVVLIVSANTESGLEKAAQALSTGSIVVEGRKDIALIAAVDSTTPASTLAIDETFQSLGYTSQRLFGLGAVYSGFQFEVPFEYTVGDDAYLDLSLAHSAMLDYNQSGIMLSLNDEPVASVRLDDTTTQFGKVRIALPAKLIHPGINHLVIRADLLPNTPCLDPRANGLWINFQNDSTLHLPTRVSDQEQVPDPIDLKRFPHPFNAAANLRNVLFVIEPDSIPAWNTAAQLAYSIGHGMHGPLVRLQALTANLPEELRASHDVIIVGQPKALPIITELGAALPIPFAPNSNSVSTSGGPITYRTENDASIGYIQLLASPWNTQRSVLAVLGNNPEGVELAAQVLSDEKLRSTLVGNLAIVRPGASTTEVQEVDITSSSAKPVAIPTPATTATPEPPRVENRDTRTEPTPTPTPAADDAASSTPSVVSQLLMLAGAILGLLVIAAISYWILRRRRRQSVKKEES